MSFELMAPLMFAGLVVFLLLGYPVAFSLSFVGLLFAGIGIWHGSLDLALVWRALRDVPKEYEARLRIVGRDNQTWGELVVPPTGPGNPTGACERKHLQGSS